MATFQRLINRTACRYLVFVENRYYEVRQMMYDLSGYLHGKGLTTAAPRALSREIRANFTLPEVMQQFLFTGEDGLIPRCNIKFHYLVLEIAR